VASVATVTGVLALGGCGDELKHLRLENSRMEDSLRGEFEREGRGGPIDIACVMPRDDEFVCRVYRQTSAETATWVEYRVRRDPDQLWRATATAPASGFPRTFTFEHGP
jgi:hypothetical protein